MDNKMKQFDFWYAVNNTEIVVPSKRHLETFGNTIINYFLVSELMDDTQKVRVREGRMQAFRPQIIMPSSFSEVETEGFGEEAKRYLEWLRENEDNVRILRYGYTLKQESFSEQVVSDNLTAVLERVKADVAAKNDPFAAVVKGVDDPWDVSLVRLFWQTIQRSAPINIRELHERHMFEMQDGIPMGIREEIEKGFTAAARDTRLIQSLGQLLQEHGVFEHYQDRFFSLVKRG
jgi:hypothetical protein